MLRSGLRRLARSALVVIAALQPAASMAQVPSESGWFDAPDAPTHAGPSPAASAGSGSVPVPEGADTDPRALTAFRPALDPYGTWVEDSKYGTVWVPHVSAVGADFAPYVSRGHWALTADEDWIWMSDYPFGWAVFHYGRWVWIPARGWAWIPGLTYANAWVVWRVPSAGYSYVGWAPMPPTWGWYYGAAVGIWWAPYPPYYAYCRSEYVFRRHVHHHVEHDPHKVRRITEHTQPYASTHRVPARPQARPTAERGAAPSPAVAPRGPRIAAARVPAWAVPARRTAPADGANVSRVLGSRAPSAGPRPQGAPRPLPADVTRHRITPADARPQGTAPVRPPVDARRSVPVDRSRYVAPAPPQLRPMPIPMRDFTRAPATPRPRR